jgi:DNA-binding transcriptional regulator YdaS (Cro superfamily)
MARQNLNKVETAATLGIARSTLDRYLSGATAIPPVVALACAAVTHKIPPVK